MKFRTGQDGKTPGILGGRGGGGRGVLQDWETLDLRNQSNASYRSLYKNLKDKEEEERELT